MKTLIAPLLASASVVACLICGVVAASALNIENTPHKFENLNSTLWTSGPVRVDPSRQTFERIAAVIPAQQPSVAIAQRLSALEQPGNQPASVGPQETAQAAADPANSQWCQARYQSYREADNSYQPLNGGPRRQCQSPAAATIVSASATTVAEISGQAHVDWCAARYSSYRLSDDSYQPFGGAERRRCVSNQSEFQTNG